MSKTIEDKTLEKLNEYIESGAYKYSGPVIGKEEVKCCIEALEKQTWISVKDRLPEIKDGEGYSDKILISTKKGDMFVGNYREYKWCGDIYVEWCSYGTGGRRMKVMSKVLAWQPLPEPYKAGGTDD